MVRRRLRLVAIAAVVATVLTALSACSSIAPGSHTAGNWVGGSATPTTAKHPTTSSTPSPTPTEASTPALRAPSDPSTVTVSGTSLFGWALLDRDTGQVAGSANDNTVRNTMESMIKPYIAADYLRRLDAAGKQPTKGALADIRLMIIDSNDNMAQKYYVIGGRDAVVQRFISVCHLTDVSIHHRRWAETLINPVNVTRYGDCLADGTAAGPKWTSYLLNLMTQVRGGVKDQVSVAVQGGRWGIIDGLPPALQKTVSIKNGWTIYVDAWHINCLAIDTHWILSVETRTPTLQKGADACASVTRQLLVTG